MRILYLNFDRGIPVLGDKGASVHVREFVRAAAALGHEVVVVCARAGEGNAGPPAVLIELAPQCPGECADGVARERGAEASGADAALLAGELAKLAYDRSVGDRVCSELRARNFRPDFVYERHALFSSAGARIAARFDCPRVLEVNAPLAEEQKRFRGLSLESLARRLEAVSFASADVIVAVSEAVKAYVEALVPERAQRIQVMANGVDVRRFAAGRMQREGIRARLRVGPDTGVIGFVGSFKSWHGTDLLLEVYRAVARVRDVHLVAVGEGPRWEEFRNRVSVAPCRESVTLAGRVPHADIPGWTAACDVVVAPYQAAADFYFSPLKVIEALACGRPVVAPRLGQLAELIAEERTGLLYHPDDAVDCRRAILKILDDRDLRTAMGRAAQASVAARGWDRIVQRVTELVRAARMGAAA